MGREESLKQYARVVKFTRKPLRREFLSTLRVVLLGLGLLGGIGFAFQLVGSTLQFRPIGGIPREYAVVFIAGMMGAILGYLAYRKISERF